MDLSKSKLIYVLIVSSFVAYTHFLGEERYQAKSLKLGIIGAMLLLCEVLDGKKNLAETVEIAKTDRRNRRFTQKENTSE